MDLSDISLRAKCLLRRAGLRDVPSPVAFSVALLCLVFAFVAVFRFLPAPQQGESFELQGAEAQQAGSAQGGGAEEAAAGSGAGAVGSETSAAPAGTARSASATLKVDVEGAVKKPGLVEVEEGARVADAIAAAGGFKAHAAKVQVNLAQRLEDGMQVYVPSDKELGCAVQGTQGARSGTTQSATGAGSGAQAAKVDINTATEAQLQELPGIGPVLAAAIVEYREQKGAFASVEDLMNVPGIGQTRFERLRDLLSV